MDKRQEFRDWIFSFISPDPNFKKKWEVDFDKKLDEYIESTKQIPESCIFGHESAEQCLGNDICTKCIKTESEYQNIIEDSDNDFESVCTVCRYLGKCPNEIFDHCISKLKDNEYYNPVPNPNAVEICSETGPGCNNKCED